MNKILIFGNPGGGKSTLADTLGKKLGIPVYHLDDVFLDDKLERIPHEMVVNKLRQIITTERWIIDGDYRWQPLEDRIDSADKIFWLDATVVVSFYRIIRRFIRCELGIDERTWLRPGQKNGLKLKFLYWVLWQYPRSSKWKMLQVVQQRWSPKITFLRSFREINQMLAKL